ncbi:aminoglycoside phosphotransferase family protein [Marinibaculum pumilum]|uniref:Aminoglycoside phosphotransferase family protein n=1 Tax=Marinibaculum pumilum TaxID=1766165 RepID=A0ABV7L0F1_9PROT
MSEAMPAPPLSAPDRIAARNAFLERAGWGAAEIRPLAGDASFRRYDRVRQGTSGAVLMDAPPDREDIAPFLTVDSLLRSVGLSAPAVLAADAELGFILLEDLGDSLFTPLAQDREREAEIYAAAVDLLAALHRHTAAGMPALAALPPQDHALLTAGLDTFLDWYWPAAFGRAASADLRRDFLDRWAPLLETVRPGDRPDPGRDVLVMRDFHADNLIWLPERPGVARVGLLDFQDAVLGHPAYDLVSLLDDVRRDVTADLAARLCDRYLAAAGLHAQGPERSRFETGYAIFGAQRNIRILGVFVRLWQRDGKARYLDYLPRTWAMLDRSLRQPALTPVAEWFAAHLPPAARRLEGGAS